MTAIIGCILAGGQSSRMGIDKAFADLHGKPLIAHAVERARPQVDELLINANDAVRFASFGCTVIPDSVDNFAGPLAGVLAGLEWMQAEGKDAHWLATFACDTPFLPRDLVRRLSGAAEAMGAAIAVPSSGAHDHPVFGLWNADLAADARKALSEDVHKMDAFVARHRHVRVRFDVGHVDPFFNINTPEDLKKAERVTPESPSPWGRVEFAKQIRGGDSDE